MICSIPKCGNIEKVYRKSYNTDGSACYVAVGEINVSERVNSFRNTSSLDAVLSRLSYMPARDIIKNLQMMEPGQYGDTTSIPTDATDAYLLLKKYETIIPAIGEELKAGKSFDSILKSIFTKESEVAANVENQSSDAGSAEI